MKKNIVRFIIGLFALVGVVASTYVIGIIGRQGLENCYVDKVKSCEYFFDVTYDGESIEYKEFKNNKVECYDYKVADMGTKDLVVNLADVLRLQ